MNLRSPALAAGVMVTLGVIGLLIARHESNGRAAPRTLAEGLGATPTPVAPALVTEGHPPVREELNPQQARLEVPREESPPDSSYPFSHYSTSEEMLADLWGERWPDVLAEVRQLRADLSKISPKEVPAWESIRGEVERHLLAEVDRAVERRAQDLLGWAQSIDASDFRRIELNPSAKELGPFAVDEVLRRAQAGNQHVQDGLAEYREALKIVVLDQLAEGKVIHHPIVSPSWVKPGAERLDAVHMIVMSAVRHWGLYAVVRAGEYPMLDSLLAVAVTAASDRDADIKSYIASL